MKSLSEILSGATKNHWATGHFNGSESDHFRAIAEAARDAGTAAIIGTSESEAKHLGYIEAAALRDALRKELSIPIFVNADHHKSVEAAKIPIDVGYDSVHIDLSAKPFDENVAGTKEIVDYAHAKNPSISVEGEVGYIVTESSKIYNEKIEVPPESLTKPDEARRFVELAGVNRLAIAVGNIHGISIDEPDLDIERIKAIRAVLPEDVALVLHAGSGIPDTQIRAAIEAGIANIHINTDIRVAFVNELRKNLQEHLDEVAMYKLDASASEAMKVLIIEKLRLFGSRL